MDPTVKIENQLSDLKISGSLFKHKNDGPIKEVYKITRKIGSGAYGEVRKWYVRESGELRAVKIIKKKALAEDERKKLKNEAEILRKMDHPNIIKLYEIFEDKKYYYIITEFLTGGELFEKITDEDFYGDFTEKDAANIMQQVFRGINYWHSSNIVHRDLKPENLLLESSVSNDALGGKKSMKIKIIDFGTSQIFNKDSHKKMEERYGTPYYIAPDVLNKSYTEKWDIWSLGVILYILLVGYPPFNGSDDKKIIDAVKKGKYTLDEPEWDDVSEEAVDLVRKCLTYDPDKRVSASEALEHTWFKKFAKADKVKKSLASKALSNLKNFRAEQKLKQATLAYIVSQCLTKEETDKMEEIFSSMDANNDGMLSKEEISNGYEEHFGVGIEDDELDKIFAAIDTDGSGAIDYSEFLMATMNEQQLMSKEKLKAAFKMFDKDGSGTISKDEIKEALGNVDEEMADKMISEVDEDDDGEISFEEFEKMMSNLVAVKATPTLT
jgi:calcium-dependent protein kinase